MGTLTREIYFGSLSCWKIQPMLLHALNFMTGAARCLFNFVYERKTAPQHLRSTTALYNRDLFFSKKLFFPPKNLVPVKCLVMFGKLYVFFITGNMLMHHLTTVLETLRCKILLISDCSCDCRRLFGHSNHPHYGANRYTSSMSIVNVSILYTEILNATKIKLTSRKSRYHILCNI